MAHISVGKMSVLDAAHCPSYSHISFAPYLCLVYKQTLMNAAPALSIEPTRKPYHHNVPALSSERSACLFPSHIIGIVTMTGTKMMTRCRKRNPVAIGSMIQSSTKKYMPLLTFFEFFNLLGTCSSSSFRDASSICCSPVLPSALSPRSPKETNAAGPNVAPARRSRRMPGGGLGGRNDLKWRAELKI
jgi:hypothetical protein